MAIEVQEVSAKLVERDLVAIEVLELKRALSARAREAHLLGQQRVMLQEALEKHKLEHLVQPIDQHSLLFLKALPCSHQPYICCSHMHRDTSHPYVADPISLSRACVSSSCG